MDQSKQIVEQTEFDGEIKKVISVKFKNSTGFVVQTDSKKVYLIEARVIKKQF